MTNLAVAVTNKLLGTAAYKSVALAVTAQRQYMKAHEKQTPVYFEAVGG